MNWKVWKKMMPFDAYRCYLSLKNHFTKDHYDYHKYRGKTRATVQAFYKRKDRFWFEKFARKKNNSYQWSISNSLVDSSFWLAWILRLTSKYWGMEKGNRSFKLRMWDGHFDGYDIWTNFAYKGDDNPRHNHAGFLSGVIYYKNHTHPTIFDEYNVAYEGLDRTMVMFPSSVWHHVEPQIVNKERITLAFNIVENDAR